MAAVLIDWGTSNVRAYAVDDNGAVIESRASERGIRNVENDAFATAFDELVGGWLDDSSTAVLMSGMIGSRQGWLEAPYLACPAAPEELARALATVPGRASVRIVPGLSFRTETGHYDVLRGEEVQCFGAMALEEIADAVICLPGTHSKWVWASRGRVERFSTAMTGETFAVMRTHSILSALMSPEDGSERGRNLGESRHFAAGLDRARDPGGLLSHLFSVRADGLFGVVPAEQLADYLSGILIGHEIIAMSDLFPEPRPVLVIGGAALSQAYCAALTHFGVPAQAVDAEQATVKGLFEVNLAVRGR